ncbi:hypothetical protein DFJ73DRAFT_663962 [Zopfochytrium polystomum]|nr:hypothetical protein DFJ73DRAFT_663962 [Zopfochytrium polystomum]
MVRGLPPTLLLLLLLLLLGPAPGASAAAAAVPDAASTTSSAAAGVPPPPQLGLASSSTSSSSSSATPTAASSPQKAGRDQAQLGAGNAQGRGRKDLSPPFENLQDPRDLKLKPLRGVRGLLSSYLLTPLIGPKCSTSLLTFHLTDFPCLRLFISKGLGIGLVAGGAVIKAPQLIKIVMKKSAVGVSFASYALETSAYIAGLAYNVRRGNPFNTYGEHAFMAVANCLVIAMMFHYTARYQTLAVVMTVTFIFTYSLFSPSIVSDPILLSLQWVAILIGVVSKVPQIYENYSTRSTGQLSAVTVGLQTIGSLARCYTTATEVKDPVILITYVVATVLNGIVSWQIYLYWGRPKKLQYKLP